MRCRSPPTPSPSPPSAADSSKSVRLLSKVSTPLRSSRRNLSELSNMREIRHRLLFFFPTYLSFPLSSNLIFLFFLSVCVRLSPSRTARCMRRVPVPGGPVLLFFSFFSLSIIIHPPSLFHIFCILNPFLAFYISLESSLRILQFYASVFEVFQCLMYCYFLFCMCAMFVAIRTRVS